MQGLLAGIRRTFVRGILLIFPLALTVVILRWLFQLVTGISTPGAERLLRALGTSTALMGYLSPLIAMVITIAVVLFVGLVGGNYAGRRAWQMLEGLLLRLPLVRWFYGSARQLMDAFRYSGGAAFSEVVLLEYPRRGIWCIGFVTVAARGLRPLSDEQEPLYVFVPTTPNPTSGYTVVLPRAEAHHLEMTVEEGLKIIFSGGFISPGSGQGKTFPPAPGAVR